VGEHVALLGGGLRGLAGGVGEAVEGAQAAQQLEVLVDLAGEVHHQGLGLRGGQAGVVVHRDLGEVELAALHEQQAEHGLAQAGGHAPVGALHRQAVHVLEDAAQGQVGLLAGAAQVVDALGARGLVARELLEHQFLGGLAGGVDEEVVPEGEAEHGLALAHGEHAFLVHVAEEEQEIGRCELGDVTLEHGRRLPGGPRTA
jgi:hypothetical protein